MVNTLRPMEVLWQAVSRDHAKDIIRRKYPDAKFYR
jgi:hypothetical protein